jgi:hypothetical protein
MPADGVLPPSLLAYYYTNSMEILWSYRSLFGDTQEIIRPGLVISEHQRFMRRTTERIADMFGLLAAQGSFGSLPPSQEVIDMIATNTALLLTGWWHYLHTAFPPSDTTIESVRRGALHGFLLIEPYLDSDFSSEVRSAIANTHPVEGR